MGSNNNIEIKARVREHAAIRKTLLQMGACFHGDDYQVDTYFNTFSGRLKIREGTIENCIVHYTRPDLNGPKSCIYTILKYPPDDQDLKTLKKILQNSIGTLVVVEKKRQIFYLQNAKFHLDTVRDLGDFFEIEVMNDGVMQEPELRSKCESYLEILGINPASYETTSYSDMILAKKKAVK